MEGKERGRMKGKEGKGMKKLLKKTGKKEIFGKDKEEKERQHN